MCTQTSSWAGSGRGGYVILQIYLASHTIYLNYIINNPCVAPIAMYLITYGLRARVVNWTYAYICTPGLICICILNLAVSVVVDIFLYNVAIALQLNFKRHSPPCPLSNS